MKTALLAISVFTAVLAVNLTANANTTNNTPASIKEIALLLESVELIPDCRWCRVYRWGCPPECM